MLVGFTKANGRLLFMLGLSRGNVDRLVEGKPMWLTPESHELPAGIEIMLFFGETEDAMKEELQRVANVVEIRDHRKK